MVREGEEGSGKKGRRRKKKGKEEGKRKKGKNNKGEGIPFLGIVSNTSKLGVTLQYKE